ncbi:TonB-dependent receptor plug domain-containing protein [Luteimonas granuli]|uniref:TonB-dependent receptor plug domain-containing protein n=1 Tax=Luteimonas granuli TaxID=1176533 RepID=UPI001AEF4E8F|nr:TonB-dependent receptor [Luteimonas granuli]
MLAAALASLLPVHGAAAQTAAVDREVAEDPPAETDVDAGAPPVELETVQVTGTRVKGGTVPSPVVVLDAERIREEGFHDLGEVVRSIPQNFTGGQNPGVTSGNLAGAGLANQNITGGSSLNLRGLGPDATLTLLNGRRMAYGTAVQAVDISAIPVEAVSRVEIVADGASAIYGSDAVAGVGNVVLKREYEGVTLGARYGAATEGGLGTREYTATAGTTWGSGGLIATYKSASVDPIRAADRDYTARLVPPTSIYPGSELGSALLSLHQSIGSRVEFTLDALRTRREQSYDFFLLGMNTHATPRTTTSFVAPAIEVFLANDWSLSAGAALGRDRHRQYQVRQNLGNGASVLQLDECYCNESRVYEMSAEGPVASLAAGEARIAVGVGYRNNEFTQFNHITARPATHGSDGSRFAYAELDVPLVSTANARAGIERLAMTAAVRGEDYDTFGSVTTPKLGLIYGPTGDVTFRASTGRSFKAPTLFERNYMSFVQLEAPPYFGGTGFPADASAMYFGGGNPDLEAERARTWSASMAFHPRALPGFEAELSWFHIDFTNRVKQPITVASQALRDPVYRQFITDAPSAEMQQRAIELADGFYNRTGLPYDPAKVVALIDGRNLNASRQTARGVDLSGSWRFTAGAGELTLRGAASWMESTEQMRAGESHRDLAGTLFNPPKLRARAGAVWDLGGFTASTFANYSDGVTDTAADRKGGSFTTLDMTLRYAIGRRNEAGAGMQFELTAQNLFNRAPPLFTPLRDYAPPYDSTNYSPVGRYLSLSVSRQF